MALSGLKMQLNLDTGEGYFFEKLHILHNDLSFLPERMKIEKFEIINFSQLPS